MIACLPMYDWPELRAAHDDLWQEINGQFNKYGIAAPENLTTGTTDHSHWRSPDLLLGQTCGYPLVTSLKNLVRYVATPHYDVAGCDGYQYSSFLLAQKNKPVLMDRLDGLRFAYNGRASLSGYRTVRHSIGEPEKIFGSCIKSGGHRQSARMLADDKADIAALDAVCWHWLKKFEPEAAAQLYEVGQMAMLPALPFITSLTMSDETLAIIQRILFDMLGEKSSGAKLAIGGCSIVPLAKYQALEAY